MIVRTRPASRRPRPAGFSTPVERAATWSRSWIRPMRPMLQDGQSRGGRWALARALSAALVCSALPVISVGCHAPPPPPPDVIRPVRYVVASASNGARSRRFSGVAQAGERSRMSFMVPGRLEQLLVKVGDRVKKKQVIGRLDPADYALQVQQAQAGLAQARAQDRNAMASYTRVRAMYENQNASKQELDGSRATSETATLQVKSISQRLQLARRKLQYATLTAPVRGVVAAVHAEVNETVSAGQPVVSLQSAGELEVRVSLPESLITQIERDAPVKVRFDALAGRTFEGRVFEVGVSGEGGASFPVTVRPMVDGSEVLPGMAADVEFAFASAPSDVGMYLPSVAVGEDRQGRFVYVVTPTSDGLGTIARTAVRIGELSTEGLQIVDGLKEGQRVVTAGVSRIRDGLTVRLPRPSSGSAAAPGADLGAGSPPLVRPGASDGVVDPPPSLGTDGRGIGATTAPVAGPSKSAP